MGERPVDGGDEALVARLADGDRDAFDALFRRHWGTALAYAMTIGCCAADAEDAASNAMFLLWKKRRQVRLIRGSLLPWLLTTVKFEARNATRKAQRERARNERSADVGRVDDVAEIAVRTQASETVADALNRLSPMDREAVVQCMVEGRSYAEVAAKLSISVPALGNRLSRARGRLRDALAPLREEL